MCEGFARTIDTVQLENDGALFRIEIAPPAFLVRHGNSDRHMVAFSFVGHGRAEGTSRFAADVGDDGH